jgi:hypothetical protein
MFIATMKCTFCNKTRWYQCGLLDCGVGGRLLGAGACAVLYFAGGSSLLFPEAEWRATCDRPSLPRHSSSLKANHKRAAVSINSGSHSNEVLGPTWGLWLTWQLNCSWPSSEQWPRFTFGLLWKPSDHNGASAYGEVLHIWAPSFFSRVLITTPVLCVVSLFSNF